MSDELPVIIPPGGGGGAPLGPGAMVANTLQGILAQRRAEAHSKLLEDLTQQKQDAEISHWQNEDAYNKDAREALAEQRRATIADRAEVAARRARFGDALKNITNLTTPAPNPQSGPVQDPNDATDPVALSQKPVPLAASFDPHQQAALQILQAVGPDDPKSPELLNTLLSRMVKPEAEYEPENWFDDVTKTTGQVIGSDGKPHLVKKGTSSHYIARGQEMAPPTRPTSLKQEGVDPKGNNVFSMPGNVDPTTHLPVLYTSDPNGAGLVQYTGPVIRPKSGAGAQPNFVIPPAVEHELRTYATGGVIGKKPVASAFTHPGSWFGVNKGDAGSLAAWKATATGAINNFKSQLPPHIAQTAADIINKAEKFEDLSSDEIAKNSNLSDDDKTLLANVLAKVRMK